MILDVGEGVLSFRAFVLVASDTVDNFYKALEEKKPFKYGLQGFILQYSVSSAEEGSLASGDHKDWIKFKECKKTMPALRSFRLWKKWVDNEKQ